ncbi:hypothetical protein [Kaarinaea lacus]
MGRPTDKELASAFQEAKRLIWQEKDQHFLAKSLFALHDRWDELSKVLAACEAYFKTGQSTTAHRKLVSAMNSYRNLYSGQNVDYTVNVTGEELHSAVERAELLREQDKDPQFIAKTILNLNHLVKHLEAVQKATERYFHTGMSEREQLILESAIKKYRSIDRSRADVDISSFGVL